MGEFVNGLGSVGIFGLVGAYLLAVAIIGKFIRVGRHLRLGSPIRSLGIRIPLGIFGVVLVTPAVVGLYTGLGGASFRWLPPDVPEHVGQIESSRNFEKFPRALVATPVIAGYSSISSPSNLALVPANSCRRVESFGLDQRHVRRLRYPEFQNQLYVYVGDIHHPKRKPFDLYLFIDPTGTWKDNQTIQESRFRRWVNNISSEHWWFLSVRGQGHAVEFGYSRKRYKVTVTHIYAVVFGTDKIAVEICELAGQ